MANPPEIDPRDPTKIDPSDLLSKFFHEAISRILPGLVVLSLYFHNFLSAAFKASEKSSLFCVVSIFGGAWLVGGLIEMSALPVIWMIEKLRDSKCEDKVPEDGRNLIYYQKSLLSRLKLQ